MKVFYFLLPKSFVMNGLKIVTVYYIQILSCLRHISQFDIYGDMSVALKG